MPLQLEWLTGKAHATPGSNPHYAPLQEDERDVPPLKDVPPPLEQKVVEVDFDIGPCRWGWPWARLARSRLQFWVQVHWACLGVLCARMHACVYEPGGMDHVVCPAADVLGEVRPAPDKKRPASATPCRSQALPAHAQVWQRGH